MARAAWHVSFHRVRDNSRPAVCPSTVAEFADAGPTVAPENRKNRWQFVVSGLRLNPHTPKIPSGITVLSALRFLCEQPPTVHKSICRR